MCATHQGGVNEVRECCVRVIRYNIHCIITNIQYICSLIGREEYNICCIIPLVSRFPGGEKI